METQTAIFGAGCFWGVEKAFRKLDGVEETSVGFSGGETVDPSYEEVCRGNTRHAEVVQIKYNPNKISYTDLLNVFWNIHDPTQENGQGSDIGDQYRSVIFFSTKDQEKLARESRDSLEKRGVYDKPITTKIKPAMPFYKAEEYHQQYLEKQN